MSASNDLLHPLATLHWEECSPVPEGGLYPQCFLLKDKLYVATTHKYSSMETIYNLHVSSLDLKTWIPLAVPTEWFGIGVYRSKLVLAGGKESKSRTITNKLWVSEDGTNWKSSVLPPMLSPRSLPSVAGAEDPDCLIVAGGTEPHNRTKKVEVLLHGCQWVKVQSLPIACCKVQSLVENGNLYLGLKGNPGREESSLLYCSLKSLLSTAEVNSHSSISDSTIIWRELKTPVKEPSLQSFKSQLIVAGGAKLKTNSCDRQDHLIYAYSPITETWVQVGDMPHSICYPAMVALSSGELVVLGKPDSGRQWKTLKASLKMSPYNPGCLFNMAALTKLEDAGFQILTTLADVHKHFGVKVGISLDQQASKAEEYVETVIHRWLRGESPYLPTWRALFSILRQLDLEELSNDIQEHLSSAKCLKELCSSAILSALMQRSSLEPDKLSVGLPAYLPTTVRVSITHTLKAYTHQLLS